MTKMLRLLLCLPLAFALAGCPDDDDDSAVDDDDTTGDDDDATGDDDDATGDDDDSAGDDDDSAADDDDDTPEPAGAVVGAVADTDGSFVGGAEVTTEDGDVATTNEQGFFTLSDLAAGDQILQISASGHAQSTKTVTVVSGESTYINVTLVAWAASETFDASTGGTVTDPDSGASVEFPPDSVDAEGDVTASIATLDVSEDEEIAAAPGDLESEDGEQLESGGMVAIEVVEDSSGDQVDLKAPAEVTVPGDEALETPETDCIPWWSFDEERGIWVEEGEACDPDGDGLYEAELPHLSWWNLDQVMESTCLNVCVDDISGEPAAGAVVTSTGVDYNGTSSATTGADGCTCVPVKRDAQVALTGAFPGGIAGPITVDTPDNAASCGDAECMDVAERLVVATPHFQAVVDWGAAPEDLDAHITGPCDPAGEGCGADGFTDRFHVYFGNLGSLLAAPFAANDTDDTSSFGPEITTVTQCFPGVYRYAVHNYSEAPGFEDSDAVVSLTLPDGEMVDIAAPAGPTDLVWVVGELTCTGADDQATTDCTWETINSYAAKPDFAVYHPAP